VLTKLLLLDGERLSYRTLAVEQIGSVYQAIMGFSLQVATGRSIAIKPAKKHGAPATVNLEELLATPADKRLKLFTEETDQKLTGQAADALKSAKTIEDIMPALQRKIATTVTPTPVPKGAMIFQPSDERRKSGSHYTPSSLTGPIVEAALEPVLKQLGPSPTPAQILNLKVCDLAMGSAAFLVEACRQLGDALSKGWHSHGEVPSIPLDEDEALYAQRLIAQRCLYGLDKNQMAADLAKLSLWLATLAKDHPFTFLDHSLRHGDALVASHGSK
jgi:type I restriction-modification system DNA methylase subunit